MNTSLNFVVPLLPINLGVRLFARGFQESFDAANLNLDLTEIPTGTSTRFSAITEAGTVMLIGENFTYDTLGLPTGGTVRTFRLQPHEADDFSVYGLNLSVDALLDPSPRFVGATIHLFDETKVWQALLDGDTRIDLRKVTPDNGGGIIRLGGDSSVTAQGNIALAGDDTIFGSVRSTEISGDALLIDIGLDANDAPIAHYGYLAGDDDIRDVGTNFRRAEVSGDVNKLLSPGVFVGGDDTITTATGVVAVIVYGDVRDAQRSAITGRWDITGGDDIIILRGADTANGDFGSLGNRRVSNADESAGIIQAGNDTITGSDLFNLIAGDIEAVVFSNDTIRAGDDSLVGRGGDDNLVGDIVTINSAGATITFGNDTLIGGEGEDTLKGDYFQALNAINTTSAPRGDDLLRGEDGNDSLFGQFGNDTLIGGNGQDYLNGGIGRDSLAGGQGGDGLVGGDGSDTIEGNAGDDVAAAGAGNDNMLGGTGHDRLNGDAGKDTLAGGAGDDSLFGDDDDDRLSGDNGNDRLDGGAGRDTLNGGSDDDMLAGGGGNDSMTGGDGSDFLRGGWGDDTIFGGDGDDTILGGEGNDRVGLGRGSDVLRYERGGGRDVINDFTSGEDRLNISDFGFNVFADLLAFVSEGSGRTTIRFDDTNIVVLNGVSSLTSADIIL